MNYGCARKGNFYNKIITVKSFSFLMYKCNKLQFTVEYNELSVYLWRFVVILYYFFES